MTHDGFSKVLCASLKSISVENIDSLSAGVRYSDGVFLLVPVMSDITVANYHAFLMLAAILGVTVVVLLLKR